MSAIWQLVRQLSNILHSNREGLLAVICKYIALFAHDLRDAEDFYKRIFSMDLLFRERKLGQEDWATLPLDKGWEDAEAVGTELSMIALRRDDFVLALFQGAPQAGTVLEFCFGLAADEIEVVRARRGARPVEGSVS